MPRPLGRRAGYDGSFSYMRETIYERSEEDIAEDTELIRLFNNLMPDPSEYPSGSQDAVDMYIYDAFGELQQYLIDEYGEQYDLSEFWDYEEYQDWRANYDGAA